MRVLAVDIGTSSVKAGIVSETGELVEWGREGLAFRSVEHSSAGLAERWLAAIERIVRRMSRRASIDMMVVSGNGPTLVPVGERGLPCGPVMLWIDRRRHRVGEWPSFYLPKIAWLKRHDPSTYRACRRFISCSEYVSFVLTGNAVTVTPSRDFTPFIWTDESARAYGIDPEMLPPFVPVGALIGRVTHDSSVRFGITAGVPVRAGGADYLMGLLGTGTVRPGLTCDRAGTSEGINHCARRPVQSPRLRTLPHVIEGLHNVAGILSSTGLIFEWFRRISGQQEKSYDKMLDEIAAVPHKRRRPVFLPSLHRGDTWEFAGAAFVDLEPDHGTGEMGRAVVESIGFSVRDLIETLERNGCSVAELRVSGGQVRNDVWNQMKADMTGRPIVVPEVIDAELLGAAVAGLFGAGVFGSLVEGAEALYRVAKRFEPSRSQTPLYDERYRRFCETRERIVGAAQRRTESR